MPPRSGAMGADPVDRCQEKAPPHPRGDALWHTAPVTSRRRLRHLVALVAALAIVVAQSASLAFACTRAVDAFPGQAAAMAPCMEHHAADAAPPGTGMNNLCEVHCQAASPPSAGIGAIAPPSEASFTFVAPLVVGAGEPASAPDARSSGPPPRSQYCRLQL